RPVGIEHGAERRDGLGERAGGLAAIGRRAGPGQVIADHRAVPAERLDEAAEPRIAPVKLEVAHPPAAEDERWPAAAPGQGDAPPAGLGEADLLLVHAHSLRGRRWPEKAIPVGLDRRSGRRPGRLQSTVTANRPEGRSMSITAPPNSAPPTVE